MVVHGGCVLTVGSSFEATPIVANSAAGLNQKRLSNFKELKILRFGKILPGLWRSRP